MENDPHESAWLEAEAAAMEEDPVTVSLGPMGTLFRQLRSAIAWQYSRLKGVQAEIEILGQGLEGLCTDLKDLSEAEDTISMCWVRQVRDLCYDTSDYLDELKHFIHSSRARPRTKRPSPKNRLGSKIFRVSRRPACNQLRLSLRKVKKLKRVALIAKLSALVVRVEDTDERRKRFKISPPQASSKNDYPQAAGVSDLMPQLPLQLHVDKLVELLGFDHDHGDDERNLKVATIFGSAGVGKTAVARTLYRKYRGRFQYRAFLRVSRDPDMRRLFHDLLSQIKAPPAHAFSDVQGLIAAITKHLLGKSYFIVIDDLWETSTWDIISQALPDGDHSRIITTTQIEDAALACCSDQLNHIYDINPLNDDKSGLSEDGLTAYHSTEEMKKTLNRVYNNLPPYLKTCLLYLNIYPEGWTVKKCELVKQWVAEGFIRSVQGQDPEETAGFYFDTLVTRGLVESVDTNHKDEVLSCTLHHMVLDLIRYKSLEENFVTIVNYFQTIIGLPDKVRRLSVQLGGAKGANNISGNMRISQVRSLIFCGYFKSVPSIIEYGLLQVLILHIWSDQDSIFDLTTIGQLYRLRYLKIKCSITVKLPHKIRRLQQLGTLHVDARLYVVPSDIVHLEKLLHLRLPSDSILPHGVGRMTRLRTLGSFDLGCNSEDNVRDLGELENLQDLQLTCSAVQPAECLEKNVQLILGSVLKKLSMLQSVTLVRAAGSSNVNTQQDGAGDSSMSISCDSSSSVFPAPAHLRRLEFSRRCCIFSRFPYWLGDLAQLCILKIAVGELLKEDIVILNGLPALASLSLHVATSSIEKIVFAKEGFTVLRYFKFTCTASWLEFEAGAMHNLEKLKLCFNSPVVDKQGTTRTIIIGRLLCLKEFTAIIGSAGVDAKSAWWKAIRNDPSNPEVQLMGMIYYGAKDRCMVTRDGSGEDGYNEADVRVEDGAVEPEWRAAESSLMDAITLHSKLHSEVNVKRADWIEEEYGSTENQHLIQEKHPSIDQPGKIKEDSDEDIKQNSDNESASALSSFPHPDTKKKESISSKSPNNLKLLMVEPLTVAAGIGWGMKAAGWVASPIISELFKKAYAYLGFNASKKLKELDTKILLLEQVMEMVEESPHRDRLQRLYEDLKSAFYQADEILDDVEYYRLKKQIKDTKMKPDSDAPPRKRDWVKKPLSAMPSSPLKYQESGMSKIKLKRSLDRIEMVINDTCKVLEQMNLPSITNANRRHAAAAASSRGAVTTPMPPLAVIGRGEDCAKITSMLHETEEDGVPDTNSAQRYSIIGIHGIGGSGKSTLAQLVCDREKKDKKEKKDGHFDLVMWVQVTQNFNIDTIFKMMFNAATGTSCPQLDNIDTLEDNLKKELHGKRFLLVLDDVWYSIRDVVQYEKLQKILTPLNAGEVGSKILVTSRTEDALIALGAAEQRRILLPALDEDVFLKLFMHYALPNVPMDDYIRRTLEHIGKEIAKKLKGSPLAARIVGGQLRMRTNVNFWRSVGDRDLFNETMGALWWSYRHLDEHVRQCFVYCSIFPRRRSLERDELVRLWAATGFVRSTNEGEDIEDVCQEYFDELVSASFLQIGVSEHPHKNDCYIIHDLLRDLAEKVAGSDYLRIENHVKVKNSGFEERTIGLKIEGSAVEVPPDVRHVFVQIYDAALITEKICKLTNLRTLIIDNDWLAAPVSQKVLESMFERLRKLRVLTIDISGGNGQELLSVPASVGRLRYLRYLAFRAKSVSSRSMRLVWPGTLSQLYHMQVLHFDYSTDLLLTSCEDICNLINLRHVICSKDLNIRSIGRLTSLRMVETFMVRKEQGYELKQLRNLNKLGGELWICGVENVASKAEALEANLADKEGLRKLGLRWDGEASADVEAEVLEGLCPPKYLDELMIENYGGLRYPSWMVGEHNDGPNYLKNLKFLRCSQELGPELRGFGTHLRRLSIRFCGWVSLPDCMEHLTSLNELGVYRCRNIRSLPTLPQSLQLFTLDESNDVLMSRCKKIGDTNWEKIQHIPRARIGGCHIRMGVVPQDPEKQAGAEVDGAESPEPETP